MMANSGSSLLIAFFTLELLYWRWKLGWNHRIWITNDSTVLRIDRISGQGTLLGLWQAILAAVSWMRIGTMKVWSGGRNL
jgi:hypothetical protein